MFKTSVILRRFLSLGGGVRGGVGGGSGRWGYDNVLSFPSVYVNASVILHS